MQHQSNLSSSTRTDEEHGPHSLVNMLEMTNAKKQEQLLHTRIWKGQSNFSMGQFVSQHQNAFVSMSVCVLPTD